MFNKSNFCHIASNNRNDQKGSVFIYKTSDSLSQVTQSGYFNEKLIDINLHDLIIHVQYDPVARTLKKSVLIVTERTMDNVATQPITDETILNDLGDLGEQVAGIEEKIPSNASATNQLATASDINTKITNCITKIPQDIKLELNNGTLTLKAGSKVYVPNGFGSDGTTPKFDEVNIASDTNITSTGGTAQCFICIDITGRLSATSAVAASVSGAGVEHINYGLCYDTSTNIIQRWGDNTITLDKASFPLAIVKVSNGVFTSIDQVFNGFGYIGGTIFALPGIKGLVPNGRNADGTLNSINVFNATTVKINTPSDGERDICLSRYSGYTDVPYVGTYIYDAEDNFVKRSSDGVVGGYAFAGKFTKTGGIITDFYVRPAFHAVDYSDTEYIAHQAMPSDRYIDLTLGTDSGALTAPADGYYMLSKTSGATGERVGFQGKVDIFVYSSNSGQGLAVYMPVRQGDTVYVRFTATGITNRFRFIYAQGAK